MGKCARNLLAVVVCGWFMAGEAVLPARAAAPAAATRPARVSPQPSAPGGQARSRRTARQADLDRAVLAPVSRKAQEQAEATNRRWVEKLSAACDLDFSVLDTDHFTVYHNWDPSEERFIAANLEDCYQAIAQQFGVSARESVFAGKAPIFMIDGEKQYAAVVEQVAPGMDPSMYVGFATTTGDGMACILMKKPARRNWEAPTNTEKRWASTLAHEMTHLFAARYRTPVRLPTWLNEGLAELMEARLFPELSRRDIFARTLDGELDLPMMLTLQRPRNSHEYAEMRTMVETLLSADSRQFIHLVDTIKDGAKPAEALEDVYGWSVDDFEENWLTYLWREYKVRPPRQAR